MAQITLRGLDQDTEQEIRKIARKSGKSLNRVILDMIYQNSALMKGDKTRPADSLRKLAGGWSQKEASEFFEAIKACEQVDEEMWK